MFIFFAFLIGGLFAMSQTPAQQSRPAPGIGDLDVPVAEEGMEIGVLFGTRDFEGYNVTWYGALRVIPIKKKGGKK